MLTALCADTMPDVAVEDVWQTLRELAFVSTSPVGLELDRVVQDVIATSVELRDPGRARRIRQIAGAAAFDEAARSPGWESTADLLHLVQNPVIRDAFSPPPGQQYVIDAARSPDRDAVDALVASTDGDSSASWLDAWWRAHQRRVPHAQRRPTAAFGASSSSHRSTCSAREIADRDPVVARIAVDLQRRPLGDDQRALVVRRVLTTAAGERPSQRVLGAHRRSQAVLPRTASRPRARVRSRPRPAPQRRRARTDGLRAPSPTTSTSSSSSAASGRSSSGHGASTNGWRDTSRSKRPSRRTQHSPAEGRRDDSLPEGVRHLSAREREVLAAARVGPDES